MIHHNGDPIFTDVDDPFEATRYHSLIVARDSLPEELEITAWCDDGLIMGLRVKGERTYGVQFHPESIMTAQGKKILENFLC
jgi:anthranilate synthase component 2